MNIDNDPGNDLLKRIEIRKEGQKARKREIISEDFHRLKDLGPAADVWAGKLPEAEENEIPELDSILDKSLDRVRAKHKAHIPQRKN